MPNLDIFNSDAFSFTSMVAAVNKRPFLPMRAGSLGIWERASIATTTAFIEERDNYLALIPSTPRGGPAQQYVRDMAKMHSVPVPHLPLRETINADELQNLRAFGTESEVATVERAVAERLDNMTRSHDATLEHLMITALKGDIKDSDGSTTITNLFTLFGVSQIAEKDFSFDTAATGDVLKMCSEIIRDIEDELGATLYDGIHCFCGKTFFDDLTSHAEVREAYARWQSVGANEAPSSQGEWLRSRKARRAFPYGGITFEEYRGKVGALGFVADTKAHFFPVGVPGLYKVVYAPATWMEAVNTLGLPRYSKVVPDPSGENSHVGILTQSNPLPICTRPRVLIQAKNT